MTHNTGIEWTHIPGYRGETWNPIVGCSVVSPGCKRCYAMTFAGRRLDGNPNTPHYEGTTQASSAGPAWTGKVAKAGDKTLTAPLRWKKPRAVFVNSMGDLFHEAVPAAWIDQVFAVMALCPQHVFIVLTKRAERMRAYLNSSVGRIGDAAMALRETDVAKRTGRGPNGLGPLPHVDPGAHWFPLPNVWLGVSAEDQTRADERIPALLETPAAARFVSCEPLLGAIDLTGECPNAISEASDLPRYRLLIEQLDWVIAGGESGKDARPMHPGWARGLRDQCASAGTPFFFKQWGEHAISEMDDAGALHPPLRASALAAPLYHWADGRFERPSPDARCDEVFKPGAVIAGRVGTKAAGCTLDGAKHSAFPACVETDHA